MMTRTNDGRTDVRMNDGTQLASYLFLLPVMIYDGVCVGLRKLRAICSSLEQLLSAHHETKKNQLIGTQIQRHGEKVNGFGEIQGGKRRRGFTLTVNFHFYTGFMHANGIRSVWLHHESAFIFTFPSLLLPFPLLSSIIPFCEENNLSILTRSVIHE